MAFLRLIRVNNLIIAAVSQWFLYYMLIVRPSGYYGFQVSFSIKQFAFLSLATVLTMLGGNVINDILDLHTDVINRTNKVLVSGEVGVPSAWKIYGISVAIALVVATWLSVLTRNWVIAFLIAISIFLLYIYSKVLKQVPIIGNVVVGFLCGLTVWIIPFAVSRDLRIWGLEDAQIYINTLVLFGFFGLFAMLGNWIREIVKDLEDRDGDMQTGSRSIAVIWPLRATKMTIVILCVCLMLLVSWVTFSLQDLLGEQGMNYYLGLMGMVSLIAIYVIKAQEKSDFKRLSFWLKAFLVQGILYVIFWHA